ncbi:MAG: arylsulfatase A-like enzyme [Paraglaciecola sp.]|jgi:arylsulfatase A-like enzyme
MQKLISLIGCLLLFLNILAQEDSTYQRPNIVLILADDVALMDFGVYGGEAATPNIDRLATRGTMFTNYHASPMCAPSRAMLLTGVDNHLTGVPNLPLFLPQEYKNRPGYEGILNDKVKTLATRLKSIGYNTYMTGKWHLGHTPNTLPSKRGFDRTYILNASGADNFEHKPYLPIQRKPPWYADGKLVDLPEDFYSSKFLVDRMMNFMEEETEKDKPFFAYLAFQAIHLPIQAPKEFIEKYLGVYDKGWGDLKTQRFERAKMLDLIPATAKLGEMLPVLDKWESLSADAKKMASKNMAVNAGMLEAMDFHIGRYLAYLQKNGKLENTVFIVTSDNGPEASTPLLVKGMSLWMKTLGGYNIDYETLGEKGSFAFIGPEFASAAAGPSAYFKFYAGEGGLRVPMIISGANLPVGQKKKAFSYITDVVPTVLEIVQAPMATDATGRSLLPVILNEKENIYRNDEPIGMEAAGQAALFKGENKLVRSGKPYGDGIWRLFNIANDPGEVNDLALTQSSLFKNMMTDYENYVKKYKVLEMPEDYEVVKEVENTFWRDIKRKVTPWLVGLVVGIVFLIWWRRRKK